MTSDGKLGRTDRGTIQDLIALLDLEPIGPDLFRGLGSPVEALRLFGGHVAAQSLVAASRTVDAARSPATIQATFLRAGHPELPVDFEVERRGDGRAFSFRSVVARQGSKPIFSMLATYHIGESGPEHFPAYEPTPIDSMPHFDPELAPMLLGAFDVRRVEYDEGRMLIALRTTERLPDDPMLHAAVLAYASDLYILDSALARHGISGAHPSANIASIDHAVWIHQAARMDEWVLYDMVSPVATAGRTLMQGRMYDAAGALLASVTQLGVMRDAPGPT